MFLSPECPLGFRQIFMSTFPRHVFRIICLAKGFSAELTLLEVTRLLSTFVTIWHRRFDYDIYCQD